MSYKLDKNNKGFTIIEVLIVLAIAALIMLIVFLAIPALQRNQRNNARNSDVGRIGSAVSEYLSNNNGKIPTSASEQTAMMTSVKTSAGTLNQFNDVTTGSGAMSGNRLNYTTTQVTSKPIISKSAGNAILIVESAQCGTAPGTTQSASNKREMAMLYTIEQGNETNFEVVCKPI